MPIFVQQKSKIKNERRFGSAAEAVFLLSAILVIILVSSFNAQAAANHYVRQGGTGDCSDWANACGQLPATLTRGDTYYIAAGTYPGYNFDDAVAGMLLITIKKAIATEHGTDTGWQSSYGAGTATFAGLTFSTSYWVFDGQVGGGPNSWNTGHGFLVYKTNNACNDSTLVQLGASVSNITIKHTKIFSDYDSYPIGGIKGTLGGANLVVSYCQISDLFGVPFYLGTWSGATIEYSYIAHNKSTGTGGTPCSDWHSEGISTVGTVSGVVIRWNLWDRIEGSGVFAATNKGQWNNWQIYGNIISRSVTPFIAYWYSDPSNSQNDVNNSFFLNNTIVGSPAQSQGAISIGAGSGNFAYNNIWYDNIANTFLIRGMTHDYQYGDSNRRVADCNPPCDKDPELITGEPHGVANQGNPFVSYDVNPLLADFRAPTQAGLNTISLIPENNLDMFGSQRAYGWERGAIVYKTRPSPPSNLRIISK